MYPVFSRREKDYMSRRTRELGEGAKHINDSVLSENHMDRGAWWAPVHRVTKSGTGLRQLSTQAVHSA